MDLISKDLIYLDEDVKDKDELFKLIAKNLKRLGRIDNVENFISDLYEREQTAPTSMGEGIAIPHALSSEVLGTSLTYIKLKNEIKWNDQDLVKYIFNIAVPKENKNNVHLKIISSLARNLINDDFKEKIFETKDINECYEVLNSIC